MSLFPAVSMKANIYYITVQWARTRLGTGQYTLSATYHTTMQSEQINPPVILSFKCSIPIFKSYIFVSFCLTFCVIPWFVCFFTTPSGVFVVRVTLSQHASVVCGLCEDA